MPKKNIRNTEWNYLEQGAGVPLVLVHGFPLDSRIWKRPLAPLSEVARVIAVDLKGFGKSASTEAFTMDSMAEELHELLVSLGVQRCVFAGLSMGAYVGLAYAEKYAAELLGFVIIDSKTEADAPAGKGARQKMAELAQQSGAAPVAAQMMPKMLAATTFAEQPAVVKELQDIMESQSPQTIANACQAMRDRPDRKHVLAKLVCPCLMLQGDSDVLVPLSMGEDIRKAMPAGQHAVIPGAGHMPPMEKPELFAAVLKDFVQQCGAASVR
jgi:pimeloyl-ACP methyl ester carboxylesterase